MNDAIVTRTEALRKLYTKLTGEKSRYQNITKIIDELADKIDGGSIGGGGLPEVTSEDIGKYLRVGYKKSDTVLIPTTIIGESEGGSGTEPYGETAEWFVAGKTICVNVNGKDYIVEIQPDTEEGAKFEISSDDATYGFSIFEVDNVLEITYSSVVQLAITIFDTEPKPVFENYDEWAQYDAVVWIDYPVGVSTPTYACVSGSWNAVVDKLDALADDEGIDKVPSVLVILSDRNTHIYFKKSGTIHYYIVNTSFDVSVVSDNSNSWAKLKFTWKSDNTFA